MNPPPEPDWNRLFPDEDYGYQFGVSSGDPAEFFRRQDESDATLRERHEWLGEDPQRYSAGESDAAPLLHETLQLAREWGTISNDLGNPPETALHLGGVWEPDFLLLHKRGGEQFQLVGGCVCFPSSWRLRDKLNCPLSEIHDPVPGLNKSLGPAIDKYLNHLKPGIAWLRSNWGLTPTPDLNYHPDLKRPPLGKPESPDQVFIRIEDQALVKLPKSNGILFGIRLVIVPLERLMENAIARQGLARALRTMPEVVAAYKNLSSARISILDWLH